MLNWPRVKEILTAKPKFKTGRFDSKTHFCPNRMRTLIKDVRYWNMGYSEQGRENQKRFSERKRISSGWLKAGLRPWDVS